RHLRSFDRRGFLHGPAPRQVRTVLERDATFRDAVVARFDARPDVRAIAEAWERDKSVELVDRCDANDDLALLASMLWASDDDAAPFWLGFVHARFEERRRAADQRADAQLHARAHEETTEARRRADAARMAAEAEVERVNAELREERRARRARE